MSSEIKELVNYRFGRACEAIEEAKLLLGKGHCNSAVSRAYYAAFYAARALLATQNLDSSKHSGVISLFNQHFVKKKVVTKEVGRLLQKLYDNRVEGDYKDMVVVSKEKAQTIIGNAVEFIAEIDRRITARSSS